MQKTSLNSRDASLRLKSLWATTALLAMILGLLFYRVLSPETILFSNDGPLGANYADEARLPATMTGWWMDLNWLGFELPAAPPGVTSAIKLLAGPVGYAKLFAPLVLLLVGLAAWFLFHRLRLSPAACVLGALAVALNSTNFSTACWGMGLHTLTWAWSLMALAALAEDSGRHRWIKVVLGGFCVGMAIMEGFDIGAIFSLIVAAFIFFQACLREKPLASQLAAGVSRTVVVALCAAVMAGQTMVVLIRTQIQGTSVATQEERTALESWDWATQWSLPKREILGVVVPGLFGYRMDSPDGAAYWGAVGRNPRWDRYYASAEAGTLKRGAVVAVQVPGAAPSMHVIDPEGQIDVRPIGSVKAEGMTTGDVARAISEKLGEPAAGGEVVVELVPPGPGSQRFSGGGSYAGVIVVVIAAWAFFASLRRKDPAFGPAQRKWIWFWAAVGVISVLLSFGRFAPFYKLLYALPYFSTIRNPAKFMHIVSLAVVVLFAYGVDGLARLYLTRAGNRARGLFSQIRQWWDMAVGFERRWTLGLASVIAVCVAGWLIFAGSKPGLVEYLQSVEFDQATANAIAAFSVKQVGWFIVLLGLAFFLMAVLQSGFLAGSRGKWGAICIGVLLVGDLTLANRPWVVYWDYDQKYASNPILDKLREEPFKNRVAILPFPMPQQFQLFDQLYRIEWTQHLFLYYNIQSLDVVQMPRPPEDMARFESALASTGSTDLAFLRRWQLTNTRYLLGPTAFIDPLNRELDSDRRRFRIVETFDVRPKPGVVSVTKLSELTAVQSPSGEGQYALFEFTGALPRASLYTAWEVITNEQATLSRLAAPDWDPEETVLVPMPLPTVAGDPATNGTTGTVEFVHYAPKRIQLKTASAEPAVLLLNDKFDSGWKVTVDGQPDEIFRANFIMRGVHLPAGEHTVEFSFEPPITGLYVTIAAMIVGLGLVGFLVVSYRRGDAPPKAAEKPGAKEGKSEDSPGKWRKGRKQ